MVISEAKSLACGGLLALGTGDQLTVANLGQTGGVVGVHIKLALFGELGDAFGAGQDVAVLGKAATTFEAVVDTHVCRSVLLIEPKSRLAFRAVVSFRIHVA